MIIATSALAAVRRDAQTDRFLTATANHEFPLCTCGSCGVVGGPQEILCHACGSTDLTWSEASGRAVVRSWVVLHQHPADGCEPRRTVVAVGELAEGPWWWAQVTGLIPEEMAEGLELEIAYAQAGEETLPVFRPA